MFAVDSEWCAAGRQDSEFGAAGQELEGEFGDRFDEVLAVVQHQQPWSVGQSVLYLRHRVTAQVDDTRRGGDRGRYIPRRMDVGEPDLPDLPGVMARGVLERHTGLPDPCRTQQSHQPLVGEQVVERLEFVRAAYQRRQRPSDSWLRHHRPWWCGGVRGWQRKCRWGGAQ